MSEESNRRKEYRNMLATKALPPLPAKLEQYLEDSWVDNKELYMALAEKGKPVMEGKELDLEQIRKDLDLARTQRPDLLPLFSYVETLIAEVERLRGVRVERI